MQLLFRLVPAAAGCLFTGVLVSVPAASAAPLVVSQLTRLVQTGPLTASGPLTRVPASGGHYVTTISSTRLTSSGAVRIPPPPPIYYRTVTEQIARWLHLTVAQVKRKLQSDIDLFYVARDQGIRDVPDQVRAHEITALQTASRQMVRMRVWTQKQADANMWYWRHVGAKLLTHTISQWFRDRK